MIIASTGKYDVITASYYLNVFNKAGKAYVNKVVLVQGKDKREFSEVLIKHMGKRVRVVEGNQIFYQHEGLDAFNANVMTSEVLFVKPIIGRGGYEYWTIASWNKRNLHELVNKISKMKGVKVWLLGIKEEPFNLFLPNVFEFLSQKQLNALRKAMEGGYYEFPRKISLEELAEKDGVNESTFREHLRKAEIQIIKAALKQSL